MGVSMLALGKLVFLSTPHGCELLFNIHSTILQPPLQPFFSHALKIPSTYSMQYYNAFHSTYAGHY